MKNVIKLDNYAIYCDTDSVKLCEGFDKSVIEEYNKFVINKIKHVSKKLEIPIEKFMPEDIKGRKRVLGIFEEDAFYKEFKTQGAKKYAFIEEIEKKDINENYKILKENENTYDVLGITVAGVPKKGCQVLNNLDEFEDNLIFDFKHTGKNILFYCEDMKPEKITDYQGNIYNVTDISGCCLLPNTYKLGKSLEYSELISDNSSKRAYYLEGGVKNK